MAAAARIPIEHDLRTSCEPDAEFVYGEIEDRFVGEYDHSVVQWAILDWFRRQGKEWQTHSLQEQRTRLSSDVVRVHDVSVWFRSVPIESATGTPPKRSSPQPTRAPRTDFLPEGLVGAISQPAEPASGPCRA